MGTIFKNAFREIKKKYRQFISLIVLIALGVGFLVGLRTTGVYMRLTGDDYFDRLNLMDVNIISTMGLTNRDIKEIENIGDDIHAFGSKSMDVLLKFLVYEMPAKAYSLGEETSVNDFVIVEGSYPKDKSECIIDEHLAQKCTLKVGDTFVLSPKSDENLKRREFTISAIVNSPVYITFERGSSTLGDGKCEGFVYIDESLFDFDYYTSVYINSDTLKALDCFSDEYQTAYDKLEENIDEVSVTARQDRLDELKADAMEEINKNQSKLDKNKSSVYSKLNSAKNTLDKSSKTVAVNEKNLKNGINKIYSSLGMTNPYKGDDLVKNANSLVRSTKNLLDTKQIYFDNAYAQLEQFRLDYPTLVDEYNTQKAQLDAAYAQFNALKNQINNMPTNAKKIVQAKKDIVSGYATYNKNLSTANRQFAKAQKKIDKAIRDVEDLKLPTWYVLSRDTNPGYSGFYQNTNRISKVGEVFPLIFFLVAALVALTNLSRMVEESRTEIGTLKALGYNKKKILIKFLTFAFASSVIGVAIGALIGYKLLPVFIYNAYRIMYTMQDMLNPIKWEYLLFPGALSILGTMAVAYITVGASLRSSPAELMRPKSPPAGKRVFMEKITPIWSHLSFMRKITVRNLFRNKGRFFMSVFGVAGCMAVLITGLGLDSSIAKMGVKQYSDIIDMSVQVSLDKNIDKEDRVEVNSLVSNFTKTQRIHHAYEISVSAMKGSESVDVYLFVPIDNNFDSFVNLQERKSGKELSLKEGEVVIDEKAAEMLNVKVGDSVTLFSRDEGIDKSFVVSGITENYVMHYVYMTPATYKNAFAKDAINNTIYVWFTEQTSAINDEFISYLKDEDGISNLFFASDVDDIIGGNFNSVILVVVCSAAALAFIVLYNLNSMNINERQRELATLKVLGFTNRETGSYIYRENIIFTIFGILLGFVFGKYLHGYIIKTVEIEMVMFVRDLPYTVYLKAAALTLCFVLIVNWVMYFVIKKINMVEALKSVE